MRPSADTTNPEPLPVMLPPPLPKGSYAPAAAVSIVTTDAVASAATRVATASFPSAAFPVAVSDPWATGDVVAAAVTLATAVAAGAPAPVVPSWSAAKVIPEDSTAESTAAARTRRAPPVRGGRPGGFGRSRFQAVARGTLSS